MWFWSILAAVVLAGCSTAPAASPATTTTAPGGNEPSAIRAGCKDLEQLKHEVSEALDSSNARARLKSNRTEAAWQAVSGIDWPGGLEGKYKQFVVNVAVLNTAYAGAISGGPLSPLKQALSKFSTDCQKEGQTAPQ
jgi:hypothetical protein